MKAKEVMETLHISRQTLCKWLKQGLLTADSKVNGQYNYNEASVNRLKLAGPELTKPSEDIVNNTIQGAGMSNTVLINLMWHNFEQCYVIFKNLYDLRLLQGPAQTAFVEFTKNLNTMKDILAPDND